MPCSTGLGGIDRVLYILAKPFVYIHFHTLQCKPTEQKTPQQVNMTPLIFYFDIVCPYAYLASLQVEWAKQLQVNGNVLGGLFKANNSPQVPANQWGEAKKIVKNRSTKASKTIGAPLNQPTKHPQEPLMPCARSVYVLNKSVWHWAKQWYWADGQDLTTDETINKIAVQHDLASNAPQAGSQAALQKYKWRHWQGYFWCPKLSSWNKNMVRQDRLALISQRRSPHLNWPTTRNRWSNHVPWFSSPFSYLGFSVNEYKINLNPYG